MFVKLYNENGEEAGKVKLPESIFSIQANPDLIRQVAFIQASNRRQGTVHTKDRSEVRGGGRKPWRQKGTGRARHGSIRSPIWIGGGTTFGPRKEKNYKKKLPLKMKRKALFMVLSQKAENKLIVVLEKIKSEQGKTKEMKKLLTKLPVEAEKAKILISLDKYDKNIMLAARNIPNVKTLEARELNVLDLLNFKYLLLTKTAVEEIEKTFLGVKEKEEKKQNETEADKKGGSKGENSEKEEAEKEKPEKRKKANEGKPRKAAVAVKTTKKKEKSLPKKGKQAEKPGRKVKQTKKENHKA